MHQLNGRTITVDAIFAQ